MYRTTDQLSLLMKPVVKEHLQEVAQVRIHGIKKGIFVQENLSFRLWITSDQLWIVLGESREMTQLS